MMNVLITVLTFTFFAQAVAAPVFDFKCITSLFEKTESPAAMYARLREQNPGQMIEKISTHTINNNPYSVGYLKSLDLSKNPQGRIEFSIDLNSQTLKITRVDANIRQRGIAQMLYARLLEIHPNIKRIETSFSFKETNFFEYQKAIESGKSPLDALKETPAYKIRKKIGFGKIVEKSFIKNSDGIFFSVVRD